MTARLGMCPRCKGSTILGVHCIACVRDSERAFALAEAMRHLARVLVWFEAEAWFRAHPGEGRTSILAVVLASRRAA